MGAAYIDHALANELFDGVDVVFEGGFAFSIGHLGAGGMGQGSALINCAGAVRGLRLG